MKKLIVFLLAMTLMLDLCGCVWFMKEEDNESQGTAAYEPIIDEIEATPEPETPDNPVSVFYGDYYDACGAMEELFCSRLEGEASGEAADTLIYLAQHNMMVSVGKVTFGWLLSTDSEGTFSSSVSGAAEGSGNITPGIAANIGGVEATELKPLVASTPVLTPLPDEEENDPEYTLNFQFGTGDVISGTLQNHRLQYAENNIDGYSVEIISEDGVWESAVRHENGTATVMRCDSDGLHFTVSVPTEYGLSNNIYQWISDSEGARRI